MRIEAGKWYWDVDLHKVFIHTTESVAGNVFPAIGEYAGGKLGQWALDGEPRSGHSNEWLTEEIPE